MSPRHRHRRRGPGPHGTNAPSTNGNGGSSASGKHAIIAPPKLPDAAPSSDSPSTAADALAALDVEVPIELTTELLLAAAAAAPAADRDAPPALADRGVDRAPGQTDALEVELRCRVMDRLDLDALDVTGNDREAAARVRDVATELLDGAGAPLLASERDALVARLVEEAAGLGPIEPLLRDAAVTDVLVVGARNITVERGGKPVPVEATFRSDAHLMAVIRRIASRAGRDIDASSTVLEAYLPDGARVSAVLPPLALDGPVLAIRRFGAGLDIETLTTSGTLTRRMATLLAGCVHARLNLLVSGGGGSGKTTLLNALSAFIPTVERVVTIEDAAELRIQRERVVRLEARRGNVEPRDLVRGALRMRPNRIVVGEVRGPEAAEVLQAMHGHEGSMATINASSPYDALCRLETMVTLAGSGPSPRALREQIASAVDVVVQVARLADGRRRVVSIAEVTGVEGDAVATTEIFSFRRSGVVGGRVLGKFEATGVRPRFAERLQAAGVSLPARLFDEQATNGADGPYAPAADAAESAAPAAVWSPQDVGSPDERHVRAVRQLESTIRALDASVDEERRAARDALAGVEEMRAQVVAARRELDATRAEVTAARQEVEEQRELQAMLQHRSRSLAAAVLGFVEVLDDLLDAARESPDEGMRDRAARLRDAGRRLLALFGVTEISGVGSRVDEAQHEVVRRVPARGHAAGTVVGVIHPGFAYHGHPLRRAQVLAAE